ncbi:MAG: hypothetical protein GY915_04990 [bacterium]|nr:hypothetical protein [bacterium]
MFAFVDEGAVIDTEAEPRATGCCAPFLAQIVAALTQDNRVHPPSVEEIMETLEQEQNSLMHSATLTTRLQAATVAFNAICK